MARDDDVNREGVTVAVQLTLNAGRVAVVVAGPCEGVLDV